MASSRALRRIVCLEPGATVILAAIDELDCVVVCTEYCADMVPELYARQARFLPIPGPANTEEIVATRPDLVIASVPYLEDAVIQILKSGARWFSPFIPTFSRAQIPSARKESSRLPPFLVPNSKMAQPEVRFFLCPSPAGWKNCAMK